MGGLLFGREFFNEFLMFDFGKGIKLFHWIPDLFVFIFFYYNNWLVSFFNHFQLKKADHIFFFKLGAIHFNFFYWKKKSFFFSKEGNNLMCNNIPTYSLQFLFRFLGFRPVFLKKKIGDIFNLFLKNILILFCFYQTFLSFHHNR